MNENEFPFVSVIIPVYNGEKTIAACIESLLNQDYPKNRYEIIVVDNNSKDSTAKIVRKYTVKYLFENRIQSSYAARNTGIRHSKGEILAFTDNDCIAERPWLINLIQGWKVNWGGIAGDILGLPARSFTEKYQNRCYCQEAKLVKNDYPFAPTANVAYKRKVFDEVGLFTEDLVSGGDADFSWRIIKQGYMIKFRKNARVIHKSRDNIFSLYKQAKRYGFGTVCLSLTYPHMLEKRKGIFKKLFKKLLLKTFTIFYRLCTFMFKKEKVYYILEPIFMIVRTYGYIRGELLGLKYMKGKKIICPYE